MNEIDQMTVKFFGDASQYVDAVAQADKATKKLTDGVNASGNTIKDFGAKVGEATNSAMEAMETFGLDKKFKDLGDTATGASKEITGIGASLKKWMNDSSIFDGFHSVKKSFDSATTAAKLLASDTIPEMFEGAWTAACLAVGKAVGFVKVAVVGLTTFVMANPVLAGLALAGFAAGALLAGNAVQNWRNELGGISDEYKQLAKDREEAKTAYQEETRAIMDRSRRELTPQGGGRVIMENMEAANKEFEKLQEKKEELDKLNKARGQTAMFADEKIMNRLISTFDVSGSIWDKLGITAGAVALKGELKDTQGEIDRVMERFAEMSKDMVKDGDKVVGSIVAMRKEVEQNARTLGMTADEARISNATQEIGFLKQAMAAAEYNEDLELNYELWDKVVTAQKELAALRVDQIMLDQAKAIQKGKDYTKEHTVSLEQQLAKMQMTTDEFDTWKMKQDLLKSGTVLSDEEFDKLRELQRAVKAQKEITDLKNKAEALNKTSAGPEMKYTERVNELNEMLARGFINQDVYNKGIEEAGKQFDEASRQADKATASVQRFDAALGGSVEAMSRVMQQRDFLTELRGEGKSRPEVFSADPTNLDAKFDIRGRVTEEARQEKESMATQNRILELILDQLIANGEDPFEPEIFAADIDDEGE